MTSVLSAYSSWQFSRHSLFQTYNLFFNWGVSPWCPTQNLCPHLSHRVSAASSTTPSEALCLALQGAAFFSRCTCSHQAQQLSAHRSILYTSLSQPARHSASPCQHMGDVCLPHNPGQVQVHSIWGGQQSPVAMDWWETAHSGQVHHSLLVSPSAFSWNSSCLSIPELNSHSPSVSFWTQKSHSFVSFHKLLDKNQNNVILITLWGLTLTHVTCLPAGCFDTAENHLPSGVSLRTCFA
jgi:hypothetical protein